MPKRRYPHQGNICPEDASAQPSFNLINTQYQMDTDTRHWRILDHAGPIWRYWDGEYVVHHAVSNDTHRLSGAAGQVLEQLAGFGEIDATRLSENCGLSEAELEEILSVLAQLEFVAWR